MTNAVWNAQTAMYTALTGASVAGGRVYDHVPQDVTFPYVRIGESNAQPDDADLVDGTDELLTIHIWSRYRGQKEIKQIMDAIHTVLHHQDLTVTGRTHAHTSVAGVQSFLDPDGLTQHGVMQIRILSHAQA